MKLYELQPSGLLMSQTAEEKKREGTEGWKEECEVLKPYVDSLQDVLVQLWRNIKLTSYKCHKEM